MALHSSLDILGLDGLACFRTLAMSALKFFCLSWFRILACFLSHCNIFLIWGVFGVTVKLGPCASTVSWAVDRGLLDRFITHHLFLNAGENCIVETGSWFEWSHVPILPLWMLLCYFLCHNLSYFFFWHSITFACLASLCTSTNSLHSLIRSWFRMADNFSSYMYLSCSSWSNVLFTFCTLSLYRLLSGHWIIQSLLCVLIVFLSFKLTGVMPPPSTSVRIFFGFCNCRSSCLDSPIF